MIPDDQNDDWSETETKTKGLRGRIRFETSGIISRAEIEYKARHKEPFPGVVG